MERKPAAGFTSLVNELGNASRTDVCLFEARFQAAGAGVRDSGHMWHPQNHTQPAVGLRGRSGGSAAGKGEVAGWNSLCFSSCWTGAAS